MDRVAQSQDAGLTVAIWAGAGAVIYVTAGIGSLLALVEGLLADDVRPQAGEISLSVRNGLHQVAWGAIAAAVSMPLGRRLVAGLRFGPGGWVVLAVGLALAGLSMFLINELDRSRNGMFDPDHVGFSWFAAPAVIAIGLAAWATLATPGRDARILAGTTLLAVLALALALLPSVPGAADGIRVESIPLASAFLADVGYALLALALVVRKAVQPTT